MLDLFALSFLYIIIGLPVAIYLLSNIKFHNMIFKYFYSFATPAIGLLLLVLGFKIIYVCSPKVAEYIMSGAKVNPAYVLLLFISPALGLTLWHLLFSYLNRRFFEPLDERLAYAKLFPESQLNESNSSTQNYSLATDCQSEAVEPTELAYPSYEELFVFISSLQAEDLRKVLHASARLTLIFSDLEGSDFISADIIRNNLEDNIKRIKSKTDALSFAEELVELGTVHQYFEMLLSNAYNAVHQCMQKKNESLPKVVDNIDQYVSELLQSYAEDESKS